MRRNLAILAAGLALALAACAPTAAVKNATQNAINVIGHGSDGAAMSLTTTSVAFDPGPSEAYNVALYLGGTAVTTSDARCKPVNNGIGCTLGDLTASTTVAFTGSNVSVNVSYFRSGTSTPLFFYLRQPNQ